jgi:restriction system protein
MTQAFKRWKDWKLMDNPPRSELHLDQLYQYPPELLELLCDAIPVLFRSKQGIIDFFVGAGVPYRYLSDWIAKLNQDRDAVRKHEIVRSVICRLNDAGDAALAFRREVIKRVSEFEDFSSCWENDRLKAQGLVGQIRHVVNVKDSFTRMNLERERERMVHQAQYAAGLAAIQKKATDRADLKDALFSLFGEKNPQKRGKALEAALNNLFKHCGILVKEAFTCKGLDGGGITEQMDGAVEFDGAIYLVEMKWWNTAIGAAEVSPHLVKVYSRAGARGLFISNSTFTGPAIETVRAALAHKICILCELQELVIALETDIDLVELFRRKVKAAISDKQPFHRVTPIPGS